MSAVARVTTLLTAVAVVFACVAGSPAAAASASPAITIYFPQDGMDYLQDAVQPADYECSTGDSSAYVTSCVGDVPVATPFDTKRAGWHTFTVQATDSAGGASTATVSYFVDDLTPPTVTVTTPAADAVYDVGSVVPADFSCDDGPFGSGIEECFGRVGLGSTIFSGDALPTDQVGSFVFAAYGYDNAPWHNHSEVHHLYQVVDRVPPTISITTPPAPSGDRLPIYTLDQVVVADYECSDNYRVSACAGPVAAGQPIDTSTAGTHTFKVEASDPGLNYVTATHSYDVHYQFSGFDSPLAPVPQLAFVRAGEKVPVKFSVAGFHGLTAVQKVESAPVNCATLSSPGPLEQSRGTLSYSAGPDRYAFQWQTASAWKGTCRELQVTLDDGTLHRAELSFTK